MKAMSMWEEIRKARQDNPNAALTPGQEAILNLPERRVTTELDKAQKEKDDCTVDRQRRSRILDFEKKKSEECMVKPGKNRLIRKDGKIYLDATHGNFIVLFRKKYIVICFTENFIRKYGF